MEEKSYYQAAPKRTPTICSKNRDIMLLSASENVTFALRQIIKECLEFKTCKLNFIDFKAAFDSGHRESLRNILVMYGIPKKVVHIIIHTYGRFECTD